MEGLNQGIIRMKAPNKYAVAAVLFLTFATLFVAIPLIFPLDDFITAAFVIAGMTSTILGIFVLVFSGNEPVDPHLIGLLPVQACMNLCRLTSTAGINGNAYFVPPAATGESRVMQFNPVTTHHWSVSLCRKALENGTIWNVYSLPPYDTGKARVAPGSPHGLTMIPSSDPLVQDLRKRNALVIPGGREELGTLLKETFVDVIEFAPRISVTWDTDSITITLHEYRFIDGCRLAGSAYPDCCARYPCPTCGLCGSLVAEGLNKVVALEKCSVSSPGDVTAVFSFSDTPEG
jgi:hypothetical protein